VVRLAWLHLRSRRAPAALAALLACSVALWASLHYHWWLGTGNAADELPMILQGCAAGIIAVTMHSPFGEPERAAGWRLAVPRARPGARAVRGRNRVVRPRRGGRVQPAI
jgi:hypothetical protein